MPIYIYKHPEKDKYIEIVQSVKDKHEFFDKNGIKWQRVFTIPQIGIDTKLNPFSQKDFINKTSSKGKMGDLLDRSKELSEKRKSKNGGIDPIQEKFFSDYSKTRKGKLHPQDPRRYSKLKKMGININYRTLAFSR